MLWHKAQGAGGYADATDPFWSNVTLLIQATGANGSQTIVDASDDSRSLTVFGNTAVTTSDGPFASDTRSIDFDGTGDYITTTPFYLTGDFTMEAFVEYDALGGVTIGNANIAVRNQQALKIVTPDSSHLFYNQIGSTDPAITLISGGSHTTGVWYHLAVTRSGSTIRLFTDGSLVASGSESPAKSFEVACIGAVGNGAAGLSDGRISELRITDGVARYTSAFTPPNGPFPTQ